MTESGFPKSWGLGGVSSLPPDPADIDRKCSATRQHSCLPSSANAEPLGAIPQARRRSSSGFLTSEMPIGRASRAAGVYQYSETIGNRLRGACRTRSLDARYHGFSNCGCAALLVRCIVDSPAATTEPPRSVRRNCFPARPRARRRGRAGRVPRLRDRPRRFACLGGAEEPETCRADDRRSERERRWEVSAACPVSQLVLLVAADAEAFALEEFAAPRAHRSANHPHR